MFEGTLSKEILSPRGMWSSVGQKKKGNPSRASFFQNARVKFNTGFAASRSGTSSVGFSSTGFVSAIHNWIQPNETNTVLFQEGTEVTALNQTTATKTTLVSPWTGYSTSFADIDVWDYFCAYDTSGNGTEQLRIYDGTNVDIGFLGPVALTSATAVDGGAGYCTIGQHFIGFVFQDRTGFAGVPTTTIGMTPISVTLASDQRQINIAVDVPALTSGGGNATLFLIMTTADNPAVWFFIPTDAQTGSIGSLPVPYNTPTTLNFVASISDEDIDASLDSALPQFLFLTQASDGSGPFDPTFVVPYGTRMCYGNGTTLYVSNQSNPQQITGDQNEVQMPSQRKIAYAFPLPGSTSIYLCGDRWTGYTTDNSDVPGTWPEPILVSEAIGAPFPNCVCYRTGGNYAWVVNEDGPYRFSGIYDALPLTHLCQDIWSQVNFAAAYAITIVDDIVNKIVSVAVPMNGATAPTNVIVIDYQNGTDFNEVDISLDVFNAATFGTIGVVKELPTVGIGSLASTSNVWIGKSAAGTIARFDPTTPNDEGAAIDSFWRCGLVMGAGELQSSMVRFVGCNIWARGTGPPIFTVYGPDLTNPMVVPVDLASGFPATTLSAEPGIYYVTQFDLSQVVNACFQFGTNAVGASWELSGLMPYFVPDLWNR